MTILNAVAPIAAMILLGAALRRWGFLPESFFQQANRLCFYVGVPALLLAKTSEPVEAYAPVLRVSAAMGLGMLGGITAAYLASWLMRLPASAVGVLVQASYRGNLAYVGLPILLYALPGASAGQPATGEGAKLAALALAPMVPLYNIAAVLALVAAQPSSAEDPGESAEPIGRRLIRALIQAAKNPLVIACLLGIAWSLTGQSLPETVHRACTDLGRMALPLALLSIGASFSADSLRHAGGPSLVAAGIKLVVCPLIGLGVALWLGLEPNERMIALVYLGCPTAVVSYIMAQQLGGDSKLAAATIAVTTALAIPSIAVMLLLLDG